MAMNDYEDPRAKYQTGVMLYDNLVESQSGDDTQNPQVFILFD